MDPPRVSTKQEHWKTLVRSFKSVFMNGSAEKNTEFGRLTVKRPSHKSEANYQSINYHLSKSGTLLAKPACPALSIITSCRRQQSPRLPAK
jgi:hypothetical protein